jgi:cobalt/nickel transport protein
MMVKKSRFIMVAILVIIIIAILAPYLASSNPDGLESTAESFDSAEEADLYEAPFPDYIVPAFGEEGHSGIVAMLVGTFMMLLVVMLILIILRRRRPVAENRKEEEAGDEEE